MDISTFCDTISLPVNVDTADTSTFQSSWKSAVVGLAGGTITFSGDYDPTATTGPCSALTAVITGGVAVAVVYKPGGVASGQRSHTFNAILTSYNEDTTVNDKVTFSCSMLMTGSDVVAVI